MNILITGANGQLGNEMRVAAKDHPQHHFIYTDIDTLDITDRQAVLDFAKQHQTDMIVNCAAYTAVDKAEDDEQTAAKINADAVRNLAEAAVACHAGIIHISTDYVFDGNACVPYKEDMPVCPTNVYGRTKLAGEQVLQQVCPDAIIVRTAWLYSTFCNNFVKTMLRLGTERDTLNVIFDQVGSPTYAADLAKAIFAIIEAPEKVPGIYHFTNEGVCSWYDFTVSIHRIAGITCKVVPIESDAYPVRTPRPHYSVLNKAKIKQTYGIEIPHWEDALQRCITELDK